MGLTGWLYLTDIVHNVNAIFGIIFVVFAVFNIILFFIWFIAIASGEEFSDFIGNLLKNIWRKWFFIGLFFVTLIITPSQRTMYLMLGSSFLSQSNLPAKVTQVLELKLDDVIKELSEKKKG